ncbi:unnamed protein product [Lathyrus sativus]|nr:unnamed protein product [Lathyrus sativus]
MEEPQPGFRFYPTEEELVGFYLHNQLEGQKLEDINKVIPVIDINGKEPWTLPTFAGERCRGETEQWFFFSPRQEREMRGGRPNRITSSGYWKATGSPSYVYSSSNKVIGIKKSMVFYEGKVPNGRKTKWKMHEYKAIEHFDSPNTNPPKLRHEFSLCRIYVISGGFSSFDRRPLEIPRVELQLDHSASTSSQQVVSEIDESNLHETSHSEGVGRDHDGVLMGGSSGTNWNDVANNGVDESEPLWEWEQLNWI